MSEQQTAMRHWLLSDVGDDIAYLSLDCAERKVNVLNVEVLEEFETLLDEIANSGVRGLVITSAKPQGFIAGADIKEFTELDGLSQATKKLRYGQELMNKLEALPCNTLAKIHGHCLGGGLELALACRWRIAQDAPDCKLGLPEVMLGIHPGYGGSVRLPELIGDFPAMQMMLSGRSVSARTALKRGLLDGIAKAPYLDQLAGQMLSKQPSRKERRQNTLLRLSPLRWLGQQVLIKQVQKRVNREHYPAPYQLIEYWKMASENRAVQFEEEAQSVATLFSSSTARNLVRTFFLREKLKTQGKQSQFKAQHAHIIGAGVMGGDIAAWCALQGLTVTLQDRNADAIAPALQRAYKLYRKKQKKGEAVAVMDRLIPDLQGAGVQHADIVIEAVSENIELKQSIYAQLEGRLKEDAILCTNTSSIPLEDLSASLQRPEQFVGLHFFNPVAKMQLIEIVRHAACAPTTIDKASAFALQLKRLPLCVKSSPGFVVNRILMPYLLEAITLVDEGVKPSIIDRSAMDFGMPMGPVALADTVGLDVCASVAKVLGESFGRSVPNSLAKHVEEGKLGRKTGQGYYRWKNGKADISKADRKAKVDDEITQRLVMALLKESVDCLAEGLVSEPDLLDAGMIFATGFAPFRGGPLEYLKQQGAKRTLATLERLQSRYGTRFEPRADWNQILQSLGNV